MMPTTTSVPELLADLWFTVAKLLGRPAVQIQLVAGLAALLAAWIIASTLLRRWNRHGFPRPGSGFSLWLEQLLYPLLAMALVYIASLLFERQGLLNGLLFDLMSMLALFLAYRIAVVLLSLYLKPADAAKYVHRLLAPLFWVVIARFILRRLVDLQAWSHVSIIGTSGGGLTLGAILVTCAGLYFWILFVALVRDVLQRTLALRKNADLGALSASLILIQYVLIGLGLIVAARSLQLNMTTIAAITGGLSIGIGIALQDVLKNFFGGLIILFEGTVRPGDWVEITDAEGEVDSVSIRSTTVRTRDNIEFVVPNQDWFSSTVKTYTRTERHVRLRIPIGVSYDADPRQVQSLLIEAVAHHPDVLDDPPPSAPLIDFGSSSIDFAVQVWVADAATRRQVAAELRLWIWDTLSREGIEIPFPQRDLHIRTGLDSVPARAAGPSEAE